MLASRAEEVPEGLDLGVSRMKSGEKAELTLSPAYGFKDQVPRPALRPGAVLPCGRRRRSWVLLRTKWRVGPALRRCPAVRLRPPAAGLACVSRACSGGSRCGAPACDCRAAGGSPAASSFEAPAMPVKLCCQSATGPGGRLHPASCCQQWGMLRHSRACSLCVCVDAEGAGGGRTWCRPGGGERYAITSCTAGCTGEGAEAGHGAAGRDARLHHRARVAHQGACRKHAALCRHPSGPACPSSGVRDECWHSAAGRVYASSTEPLVVVTIFANLCTDVSGLPWTIVRKAINSSCGKCKCDNKQLATRRRALWR